MLTRIKRGSGLLIEENNSDLFFSLASKVPVIDFASVFNTWEFDITNMKENKSRSNFFFIARKLNRSQILIKIRILILAVRRRSF